MMEGIFSTTVKFTPEDILKHFKNVSLRAISIYSVTFGDYYILTEPYIIFQLLLHYLQQLHPYSLFSKQ